VTVALDDLPAGQRSYTSLLGREADLQTLENGLARRWFALENVSLELRQRPSAESEGPVEDSPEALRELGFACADLDAALRWSEERGLAAQRHERPITIVGPSDPPPEQREPDPVRACLALDPSRTGGVPLTIECESSLPLEVRPAEDSAVVTALDHVVIRTVDANAARTLYGDTLGLRVALDREFEQWGVRLIFCRLAGLTVEIAAAFDPTKAGMFETESPPTTRDSLWGLSWRVSDADAARQRLDGLGFDVSEVRPGRKPGTRVFTVREGTCGVPTLFIEPSRA
jgi:catechol 2,3-dioxygenase-like lactoylglutathione lyase family enzyme